MAIEETQGTGQERTAQVAGAVGKTAIGVIWLLILVPILLCTLAFAGVLIYSALVG